MKIKRKKIHSSGMDLIYDALNMFLLILILVIIAYPLYFLVIASFSDASAVTSGQVWLFPKGINIESFRKVFEYDVFWASYRNTAIYTVLSTVIGVLITLMAAYPLAIPSLPGKKWIMLFFVFTMFFSGGLIPTFITVRAYNLNNTPAIVIILGCFSVFNLIIARTFIQSSIPREIFEAADIDGCGFGSSFFNIVIPLAKPIIAVLIIYIAVWQWNSYFTALVYLTDRKFMTLQLILREILTKQEQMMDQMQDGAMDLDATKAAQFAESIKYAIVIVASLPIMSVYPFMQKYFVKGVFIGSIKG